MSAGFTPGPWCVNIARLSDGSILVPHVLASDRASVAQIAVYGEEETVANARLIAAAPELFAAVIEVADCEDGVISEAVHEMVLAAIDKALGR